MALGIAGLKSCATKTRPLRSATKNSEAIERLVESTFVPARRLRNVRKSAIRWLYETAPPGAINLGLGEPAFRTPQVVRREAVRVIEHEPVGYTANAGIVELRVKIAESCNALDGASFDLDNVCVTSGSAEALFAVVMAIVDAGDRVLVPDPGYVAYPTLVEMAGGIEVRYPLPASRGFTLDRDAFARALTPDTRLVILLSPSNPTSQVLSPGDLSFIADRLRDTSAYVLADEIYRELYFTHRGPSIASLYERTLVVSGLSKNMSMTGWRLGWAVGPSDVISHVSVFHQYLSTCASSISQRAALAAFTPAGREAAEEMRIELRRRRDVMAAAIERELRLPATCAQGGFYTMLDVSSVGPSASIARALLNHGVVTVPGSAFGAQGEGYLRLSFASEPADIEEGIRRIRAGLEAGIGTPARSQD